PLLCGTGRLFLQGARSDESNTPLMWDEGPPWELALKVELDDDGAHYRLTGGLRRAGGGMALTRPNLFIEGGLVFCEGSVARLNDYGAFAWISVLRSQTALRFIRQESDQFLDQWFSMARQPQITLPADLNFETVAGEPKPRLALKAGKPNIWG